MIAVEPQVRSGVALVIQGGAMRSIYCLGATRALLEKGQLQNLTSIHVASAGCVAGLILVGSGLDVETYMQMSDSLTARVASRRFIDSHRVTKMVDVEFLVDCMLEVTSMNAAKLRGVGIPFEVALTDAEARSSYVDIATYDSDSEVKAALIATMAIPIMYPAHSMVGGNRYYDGGIGDPLPLVRALSRKSTKSVLAVTSVGPGLLGREATAKESMILKVLPGIPSALKYQMLTKNALGSLTDTILHEGLFRDVPVLRIGPATGEDLGDRLNINLDHLSRLDSMGYNDAQLAIDGQLSAESSF